MCWTVTCGTWRVPAVQQGSRERAEGCVWKNRKIAVMISALCFAVFPRIVCAPRLGAARTSPQNHGSGERQLEGRVVYLRVLRRRHRRQRSISRQIQRSRGAHRQCCVQVRQDQQELHATRRTT
ncbi:hypothetical protein V5799_004402 [Amblyomma americanum]|uniref:Uncharacterized protein n=1 Tax=Amblyomma americanum TaxID=6943 RepID=A0AAQ4D678_AMBAM